MASMAVAKTARDNANLRKNMNLSFSFCVVNTLIVSGDG